MSTVNFDTIIIRYGEIALKSEETRRRFENVLINNIKNALFQKKITGDIKKERGRIFFNTEQIEESIKILKRIFGIISISIAFKTKSDMDSISHIVKEISKNNLNKETSFALRVTRTGNHDFSSQDVAIKIGNDIVNLTKAKVNLDKPDFEIFIEIRNQYSYIFREKINCLGGMPISTQGNVLSLVNDEKSLLAAWYILRRGCYITFVTSNDFDITAIKKFSQDWLLKEDIIIVDFNSGAFYSKLKKIISSKNCDAIISGNTLFNNSIKDIIAIKTLKQKMDVPILHPLIAMKKNRITKELIELGISI
jgi:adenylyl- and sulfurtransferase ThiI